MVQASQKPSAGHIFQAGLIAGVASALVNATLYLITSALGFFPGNVLTPAGQPCSLAPVIIVSLVSSLGAAAVYALLVRYTANPKRIFMWVAAVVFVLMFFNPFMLQGAPPSMIVSLEIMHGVVAGFSIYLLTRLSR